MTASFDRFLNVAASFQAGTVLVENLDGQGLYMGWTFTRTINPQPDQGELRIANLSETVRKTLQEEKVNLATFKGTFLQGWDGSASLLFDADIYDIVTDERSDPTTSWTIMRIGDNVEGIRDGKITQGFGDVDINTLIKLVAGSMEIASGADAEKVIGSQLAKSTLTRFKNGIVAMDSAREVMNEIMGLLKLKWTVQNGRLVVFPEGETISGLPAIDLRPGSGLINWTPARDGSIKLEALSLPECTPGRQIRVFDEIGKPVAEPAYRVESVVYKGDTMNGAFMHVEARRSVL